MSSRRFHLFTALFFAAAVQAASGDGPRANGETVSPAVLRLPTPDSRLPDPGGDQDWGGRGGERPRDSARYGTGYEARQVVGSQGRRGRGR